MAAPPRSAPSSGGRQSHSGGIYVGRYKRLDSIGKGSFATVYKAVHPVCSSRNQDHSVEPLKSFERRLRDLESMRLQPQST